MYTTDGDSKREVSFGGKYYRIYCSLESKKGRGTCNICDRKKYYFTVDRVIGIEEEPRGDEVDKNSALGKEIIEKLKRVVRRETICDHCDLGILR